MSTASTATSTRSGRLRGLIALDGPLATLSVTTFQYFVLSLSFIATLTPLVAFSALIGWQATHLAIVVGAVSTLPLVPAAYALLTASRELLSQGGDAHTGRAFWRAFGGGCRLLWWAALGLCVVVVLLGYDIALNRATAPVLVFAAAAAAVIVALLIATVDLARLAPQARATALLIVAARRIARRPHVALSWLLLIGAGSAATALPVAGPAVALFLPALLGVGIHVCNDALRFHTETRRTP